MFLVSSIRRSSGPITAAVDVCASREWFEVRRFGSAALRRAAVNHPHRNPRPGTRTPYVQDGRANRRDRRWDRRSGGGTRASGQESRREPGRCREGERPCPAPDREEQRCRPRRLVLHARIAAVNAVPSRRTECSGRTAQLVGCPSTSAASSSWRSMTTKLRSCDRFRRGQLKTASRSATRRSARNGRDRATRSGRPGNAFTDHRRGGLQAGGRGDGR